MANNGFLPKDPQQGDNLIGSKSFNKFLFGSSDKVKKATTQTPEQTELLRLITEGLKSGQGPFKDIFGEFNPEEFKKGVSDPALKNFKENILPAIQEKYLYAANGSGLRRNEQKAGVDLQSKLAELMYNAQQGQKQNRAGGIQQALGTKPFENIYKQGETGALQGFLKGAGEGVGKAATMAIAG